AYKNWARELTIDGASVFFKGPLENADESNGLMSESRTKVQNGGRITFSGADLAIKNSYSSTDRTRLVYSGNYALIVGDEPEGGNLELYAGTGNDYVADIQSGGYKYLTLGEAELFVGGVAITPANQDDIVAAVNALYPDSITGSAVYDPDAHKLTLSGVSLVNKSTGSADKDYAAILYAGTEPLEIVLEGENSVTGRDRSGDDSRGLYSQKAALSFTGSGSLTATGGNITSGYGESYGISAYYGMTFDGPTIKAYGGSCPQDNSYGIFGGVALTDGKIEAYGGTASNDYSYGIDGDVTVDGGELTATGGSSRYDSYGIGGSVTVNGGKLTATGGSTRYDDSYGISGTLTLNDGEVFACGGSSQGEDSIGVYRAEVKGGKLTARAVDSYYTSCGVYSSLTVSGGEANISGASETNSASYGVDSSVTISGGKTVISSGNGAYTRGIYGSLTVTGGQITVTAEEPSNQESGYCYGVNGNVSISGGKAKISSSEAPTSYAIYGYPDIRGGSLELIADGSKTAQVCTGSIYVSENGEIRKVSPNADGSEPVEFDRYAYESYKYLLSGSAYKLWVGDVRVNDENASDVLGDGTVSFDEATSTLTLNGANITPETRSKGIEFRDDSLGDLTVLVKGENSINVSTYDEYGDPAGIYTYDVNGDLNIVFEEGASLTIDGAGKEDMDQTGYGIFSRRSLNISGPGTLQIDGIDLPENSTRTSYGIYIYNGDMTLSDGVTVDASGGRTGMRSNYYGNMNYGQSNGVCSAYGRAVIVNSGCELKARAGEVQCENDYYYRDYALGINAGSITVDGSLTAEGYRAVNCTVTAGENTIVYAGADSFEAEKLDTLSYSGSDPYVRVMEKKPFLLGDVNCDGEVTAADLTKLARHVAKIELLEDSAALQAADVTKDDAISAADLTKLARYVAQIIKTFD
ncbi:MAG: dockerin type I repeat-containing protein, partial [Firmicutes bacterium]|nr:dockerin type I repeat-containing protein [Bacillota bacterium]